MINKSGYEEDEEEEEEEEEEEDEEGEKEKEKMVFFDPNLVNKCGMCALHLIATSYQPKILKEILNYPGIDLNIQAKVLTQIIYISIYIYIIYRYIYRCTI